MKLKPKLRPDARHDLRARIYNAVEIEIEKENIYRNCMNCINFREMQNEVCDLVMQRPPARVIAYGCPKWEDKEDIPF